VIMLVGQHSVSCLNVLVTPLFTLFAVLCSYISKGSKREFYVCVGHILVLSFFLIFLNIFNNFKFSCSTSSRFYRKR
jgi:hypothetical protein